MKTIFEKNGYICDPDKGVWSRPGFQGIAYNDGDEVEDSIARIIQTSKDVSLYSLDLKQHCTDWPTLYHLSAIRSNILRPFESSLKGRVLEIGGGCGAITRYLGESGGEILTLEGSVRRAGIARSRTRDLSNVEVLAESFESFEWSEKFDVVTLIGVLEYANIFMDGSEPALELLKKVRSLLAPSGLLIIAIENQLGLKYLAGAPEDHVGIPMFGVEGRYKPGRVQTYGKEVLGRLLQRAGFKTQDFLNPLPDYKFPTSIVTESGISDPAFDASAFAWQSVRRDPQIKDQGTFLLERAWPEIYSNGLGLDLANSFLVATSPESRVGLFPDVLAFHYSVDRLAAFNKITLFRKLENSHIALETFPLYDKIRASNAEHPIVLNLERNTPYFLGTPLSIEFLRIVTDSEWSLKDVGSFLKRYVGILAQLIQEKYPGHPVSKVSDKVPSEFFDAIPSNIIISASGVAKFIDQEWILNREFILGHLLCRAIFSLTNSIVRFGECLDEKGLTRIRFFTSALESAGYAVSLSEVEKFLHFETTIQSFITGRPEHVFSDWKLNEKLLSAKPLGHVDLLGIKDALDVRTAQYHELMKATQERDQHIKVLDEKILELGKPFRFGSGRKLIEVIHKRDLEIVELKSKLVQQAGEKSEPSSVKLVDALKDMPSAVLHRELLKQIDDKNQQITNLKRSAQNWQAKAMEMSDWATSLQNKPLTFAMRKYLGGVMRTLFYSLPLG
ncbi:MAG: class I SAM-dependent methyltransferase, partial [Proteobacteria bacterium]